MQSYQDYEILIIDDGSTDNTDQVLAKFADDRLVYIKNEQNLGIVTSLNKGIGLSRGQYIVGMDADDIMLGNRLAEKIHFLETNSAYGMVGGWYQVMNEAGKNLKSKYTNKAHEEIKLDLLFSNQFAHTCVTMRTELVKRLMYKPSYIYTEDFDLWCRMAPLTTVANLLAFYLCYRWYNGNTCDG